MNTTNEDTARIRKIFLRNIRTRAAEAEVIDREIARKLRYLATLVEVGSISLEEAEDEYQEHSAALRRVKAHTMADRRELADLLKTLSPASYGKIREAYFRAAEGLTTLHKALEAGDAELGGKTKLLGEHYLVGDALQRFTVSCLGKYL